MDAKEARRFFGFFRPEGSRCELRRRGLFLETSADGILAALERMGHDPLFLPVESGLPRASCYVGLVRTLHSPWTQLFEEAGSDFLGPDRAQHLSRAADARGVWYDYDFSLGRFRHRMWQGGDPVDGVDLSSEARELPRPCEEFFRFHRMREWGISVHDLAICRIPFPPTVLVESYFIRIRAPVPGGAPPGAPAKIA
ncbi:MAG: hypothetical protein HY720_16105 [Planctomycetes bacterium]|nr:hypothetical protein [Planctomycetota bacterium]